MKIGLLIYGSLDTISGGFIYDRYLADYLRAQGEEVEIISLPWRRYALHISDNFSARLFSQLDSLQVDALIQDELCHPSLFHLNRRIKGRVSYPIIALVHHLRSSEEHPAIWTVVYQYVEKKYLQSADGFIFNSQTTKSTVRNVVPQLPAHVVAFPGGDGLGNGLSENEVTHRASEQRPLRILFLGSLTRRKGAHTLLDACNQLEAGSLELTIIGSHKAEPRYARQIQARISEMRSKFSIKILDALPTKSLPKEISQQDILVVPSSYEGFGIVYLEGMAFGLPAIATTSGAAHETVIHDYNGYLIPPGDSRRLALHLGRLAKNRKEKLRLSLNALATQQQGPTWKNTAQTIHKFLYTIANHEKQNRSKSFYPLSTKQEIG